MICGSNIQPASSVRDLGVWIDSGVTMSTHISKVVAGCFATLRQLRSIRRSLTQMILTGLVVSLVLTRVDYYNSVLTGLSLSQLNKLQAVINAAAHLILSGRRCDYITLLLMQLHWLHVPERIEYKLCVLVYRCLHSMAPEYLANSFQRVSDVTTWQHLRSAATSQLIVPATRCSVFNTRLPSVPCRRCSHLERSSAFSVICFITPYFQTTFKDTSFPMQFSVLVLFLFNICTVPLKRFSL